MNAASLPPADGTCRRTVDSSPCGKEAPTQPSPNGQSEFEALLRRQASAQAGGDHVAAGAELDGAALRGPSAHGGGLTRLGHFAGPADGVAVAQAGGPVMLCATLGSAPLGAAGRPASGLAPVGIAPSARRRSPGRAEISATCSKADGGTTWKLVEELVSAMHVSEPRKVDHASVHLVLKGSLLDGTRVLVDRQGHRLTVHLVMPKADMRQRMDDAIGELERAIAGCMPQCQVEVIVEQLP